jgi:hypothetical protein
MKYDQLIQTVSLIIENPNIQKKGLTLTYQLSDEDHLTLNETLFIKTNPYATSFVPTDEFEIMISGILVKFVKAPK